MDKIVICLLNWINNEINIKEDISELIENIAWNEIALPLLFEFIIKYGKNISEKQLDTIFINSSASGSSPKAENMPLQPLALILALTLRLSVRQWNLAFSLSSSRMPPVRHSIARIRCPSPFRP